MTLPPPDPPLSPTADYAALPARRPWALSEIFSWAIILTLVILLCVLSTLSQIRTAPEKDNPALVGAARVAVAQHNLLHADPASTDKLLASYSKITINDSF